MTCTWTRTSKKAIIKTASELDISYISEQPFRYIHDTCGLTAYWIRLWRENRHLYSSGGWTLKAKCHLLPLANKCFSNVDRNLQSKLSLSIKKKAECTVATSKWTDLSFCEFPWARGYFMKGMKCTEMAMHIYRIKNCKRLTIIIIGIWHPSLPFSCSCPITLHMD